MGEPLSSRSRPEIQCLPLTGPKSSHSFSTDFFGLTLSLSSGLVFFPVTAFFFFFFRLPASAFQLLRDDPVFFPFEIKALPFSGSSLFSVTWLASFPFFLPQDDRLRIANSAARSFFRSSLAPFFIVFIGAFS